MRVGFRTTDRLTLADQLEALATDLRNGANFAEAHSSFRYPLWWRILRVSGGSLIHRITIRAPL